MGVESHGDMRGFDPLEQVLQRQHKAEDRRGVLATRGQSRRTHKGVVRAKYHCISVNKKQFVHISNLVFVFYLSSIYLPVSSIRITFAFHSHRERPYPVFFFLWVQFLSTTESAVGRSG